MDLDRINELGFEKSSKWKTMVLVLSFSMWWNLMIVFQCYFVILMCTFELAFQDYSADTFSYVMYLVYVCDVCYLFEVICTIAYRRSPAFKKLRYSKSRQWYFIALDIISLLPLELMYVFHYIIENKISQPRLYFIQNRILRIYRIFQLEFFYGITVRKSTQYAWFMFFQFTSKSILVSHIMCCIWTNLEQSVPCDSKKHNCWIWCETHTAILVILNWSGPKRMFQDKWERVVALITMLIGFLLIYAHFYPYTLYVSMQLNSKKALYYDKYQKLEYFLRNMMLQDDLKTKVLRSFNDILHKDKSDLKVGSLLKNIPLALRKEIFTDIYWEAFRHSGLLRGVSRNCKRSLSLLMHTESYHTGEIILRRHQEKLKMMFLVQGIVQIMAEENEESPVLSLSSGTVFGELSLFLITRSQALVKCKSYCELQILKVRDAVITLSEYPEDREAFNHYFQQRLSMAKFTQWRKQKFVLEQKMEILDVDYSNHVMGDCVKWVKTQWRSAWENHKRHMIYVKALEEGLRLPAMHRQTLPDIKIEYISNYLDLIVLSDVFEEKKDVVCLRTSFPWSIDPSTQFLKIWTIIIRVVAVLVALTYPLCTSWITNFPWWVYIASYLVTALYIIDVLLKLMTAVKTKHLIVTNFNSMLTWKLQEPTFYLDVLAALPYQFYIVWNIDVHTAKSYTVGLILHPAILKSHVFLRLEVSLSSYMEKTTLLKNILIFLFMVYMIAEFIQLLQVRDLFTNVQKAWLDKVFIGFEETTTMKTYLAAIIRAWATALSIPDYTTYPEENHLLIGICLVRYVFFFFFCFFLGDFYSKHTMKIFSGETFEVLLKRIKKFLESIYVPLNIMKQLMKTLRFQWDYDQADHLSSKVPVTKSIPDDLRKSIYHETTYKTLLSCRMFRDESNEFISEVLEKCSLVAVPTGSVLVTFGHTSHSVSVIHRGFCQITSFLTKDISAGLGRSFIIGPGDMFPMLSSFCNSPAPVSVITVTDCEVIMINLEDLLTLMIKHNALKDMVDVVLENNFAELIKYTKPALLKLKIIGKDAEVGGKILKCMFCGPVSRILCRSHKITMKVIHNWQLFYHFVMIFICIIWPCCFGIFIYFSHILFPVLSVIKTMILFYMVVEIFVPYYNKKGLLVSHPKFTSLHYLSTSFTLDAFSLFPIFPIYLYLFSDPYKEANYIIVLFSFLQNYIKIFHVLDCVNHVKFFATRKYYARMIKIVLMISFSLNVLANLSMYFNADWEFGGPYVVVGFTVGDYYNLSTKDLVRENNVFDYYMFIVYWMLCNFMAIDYWYTARPGVKLFVSMIESFVGNVLLLYLYAWMSSNSMFANIGGTIFQERITSFVQYLEFEKADDQLIELAISHYKHEWSQTQGESLKKIFEHLPVHLHEELAYPLYRPTIAKNEVFAQADEGFFKIMSMHVTNVYFNRGSVIMFQNECQSDIYFVHKGKCFVYDWFLMLDVGSIIGDIKQKGLMENKVYALTHVEMLKISSNDFFMILNNFYDLEANFLYTAKNGENYIKSRNINYEYQLRPVDSRDVLKAFGLQKKDLGFEDQSYFEDPENSYISLLKLWKARPQEKMKTLIIYPGTWKMTFFNGMYLMVALTTLILIPTQMSFGSLTPITFTAVGILDFFWFAYIILSFRVGYIDSMKGDVVTDFKFIARSYAKRWNGLVIDTIAIIPFELIPVFIAGTLKKTNPQAVSLLRLTRLLRGINLFISLRTETRKLKNNLSVKYMKIVLYFVLWIVVLVNLHFSLSSEPTIVIARNPHKMEDEQFWAIILVFEYVMNIITSANLHVLQPRTMSDIILFNVSNIFSPYAKGWLISQVLSILYVKGLATAYYKSQVMGLELFLKDQETSPSIVKEVLSYKLNLLQFSRSENMPVLLKRCPTSLRIAIMKDLYLHHLMNFPLFQDLEPIFLHQLVARLSKETYFPGQKIVEQGDVDHQMFFIHFGEIYVLNHTRDRSYVEYVVGKMYMGEYFGEAQGLWFHRPHTHTYRARTQTEILVLHCHHWSDLRRNFPDVAAKVWEKAKALRII